MAISDKLPGMKPGSTIRNGVVGIVYIFGIMVILGAAMGGGEEPADDTQLETDGNADKLEEQNEGNSGDGSGSEADSSGTSTTFTVRVQYSGDWSGAISGESSSRSVDGSGEQTFDIEGDPTIVSANAQRQDNSSDELTIQILKGGEVVSEQSTTAEYGVAQTSYSNF